MEYFAGALITLLVIVGYSFIVKRKIDLSIRPMVNFNQSYIYNLLFPLLPTNEELSKSKPIKTQARLHKNKVYIKILFMDGKAYWIKNNVFYTADMEDGKILEETAQKVDTMTMDKVQLNKMSFIVEKLTEGLEDDNRNSGIS